MERSDNWTNETVVRADGDLSDADLEGGGSARALLGFVLFLLIVSTLLGNTLVCAAVVKFRHLRSKVTNFFVVSLAVSDLFVAVLVMPWEAMSAVAGTWLFGRFCAVWIAFDIMCSTASILNLCMISVDRYWAIASPFRYERRMTHRVAFAMIGVAWTLSVLISFIPVQLNWHEQGGEERPEGERDGDEERREEQPERDARPERALAANATAASAHADCKANLNRTYAISSSLISFYIPVLIMIATYTRIFRIAQTQIRRISSLERAAGHSHSQTAHGHEPDEHALKTTFKKETKVLKTLSVIMGVFVCCWLPFFVLNCAVPFCRCVSDTTFAIFVWFGWANSSLNPVIYAFNADFRRAFSSLLGCNRLFASGGAAAVEAVNFSNELVSYHHDTTLQKDAPTNLQQQQQTGARLDKVSISSGASRRHPHPHAHALLPHECDGEISLDTITPFTSTGLVECEGLPGQIMTD
ncbi:D(1)-like dopamine receptor [Salminus brasiliensis]|uniref:D(1)-like dopamine receptor n=1 Tax=Salminus brasiliensis TaxID=930266 RepID=UPI003B838FE0